MRLLPVICAFTLAACGDDAPAPTAAAKPPQGVVEDCASQSSTSFGAEYDDPDNLVVGPLAMLGAAHVRAETVREFGGDKVLVLVKAGHRVTVAVETGGASLGYGPLPQGVELRTRDGHRVVTFEACSREKSASRAAGEPVTFWSGFILTSQPRRVELQVWVDEEPPRRVTARMGVQG